MYSTRDYIDKAWIFICLCLFVGKYPHRFINICINKRCACSDNFCLVLRILRVFMWSFRTYWHCEINIYDQIILATSEYPKYTYRLVSGLNPDWWMTLSMNIYNNNNKNKPTKMNRFSSLPPLRIEIYRNFKDHLFRFRYCNGDLFPNRYWVIENDRNGCDGVVMFTIYIIT